MDADDVTRAVWRMAHEVLSERVERLCFTTGELTRGNYSARLRAVGTGPLGKLGRSFNYVATDLERHVEKLRVSEERFELAAAGSNEVVWDWDMPSSRLFLSPRSRRKHVLIPRLLRPRRRLRRVPRDQRRVRKRARWARCT